MCDLGVSGIERVYWTVFSDVGGGHGSIRAVLVGTASATALVGAAMAFLQSNLKRMIAFVTVSQIGIVLAGVGLLTARGLGGATIGVVAQGLVRGALFLAVGLVLHELRHDDELRLRGLGRRMVPAGVLFAIAAFGVAGMPPFGPFLGTAVIEQAAVDAGYGWLPAVLTTATIVSGAALVRACGRIFLGLGADADEVLARQPEAAEREEGHEPAAHRSPVLLVPTVVLLIIGLGLSLAPRIAGRAEVAAAGMTDRGGYAAHVLRGVPPPSPPAAAKGLPPAWTWGLGAFSVAGALGLATVALHWRRRPGPIRSACRVLHAAHTGVIGDYVAWLLAGTAALGALFALLLT
jgi:multicomponent Na+:H+ antiporter subunit D